MAQSAKSRQRARGSRRLAGSNMLAEIGKKIFRRVNICERGLNFPRFVADEAFHTLCGVRGLGRVATPQAFGSFLKKRTIKQL